MKPIAVGSDHAGFALKEAVKRYLGELGLAYKDFGAVNETSVDYPEFGYQVGKAVASGQCEKGILVCGSGIGISIAANKVKGVRAALCHDAHTAALSRKHNDANVLAMGGRIISEDTMREMVQAWLTTPFEGGRHQHRIDLIKKIENEQK